MTRIKKGFSGLTLALGLLVTTACGTDTATDAEKTEPIKIGVVSEVNEVWDFVKEKLAADGIEIELVKFTDYATPNVALAEGELDLNSFQTKIFMDSFNKDHDEHLVAIADTVIAPLGIYSSSIQDISEIKEKDVIAIPNDVSNEGRALLLLQTAGLIEVDPSKGQIPVVEDVISNPLKLTFETLDSSQTARALDDVTVSVINSGMAVDAGFVPTEDAVFLEPVTESSDPYYNAIVSRENDKENEVFKQIIEAYQAEDTKEVIKETSKGSSIPVW